MKFKKIGFIGLGLIGGSIAKAIKHCYPETLIYGHDKNPDAIREAHEAGVTENESPLPLADFGSMDLLFLCCPVMTNISYLREISPHLSEDIIITDVGSVKGEITREVKKLGLSSHFIGGHPMTGSEKTGFSHSSVSLLENAYYIITDNPDIAEKKLAVFGMYLETLGVVPLRLSCSEHDFATAAISHLPHVMSAALVNLTARENKNNVLRTIAAGGFRDVTRIAASSPDMWRDICIENRDSILSLIDLYQAELSDFRAAIDSGDADLLYESFSSAKEFRDSITIKKQGILPRVFSFYCDLSDEVGGIARVAQILADRNLSIKNIGIIHNREFAQGALHVEMYDASSLTLAMEELTKKGYTVYPEK